MEFYAQLLSGATAGVIADVLTHPFSTVKTILQVQGAARSSSNVINKGPISALFTIVKAEGFRPLYKGVGIVVVAAAPSQALYFGGYETVRKFGYVFVFLCVDLCVHMLVKIYAEAIIPR